MSDRQFISEQTLLEDSFRLGVQVANSGFRPSFIAGLWRGGSAVGIYVQECLQTLGIDTDHIALRTSYRGRPSYQQMVDNADAEIRIHGLQYLLETLEADDGLLIVDDVFSSGQTMAALLARLRKRLKRNMPEDTRIAVPFYKPAANRTAIVPDYALHETDNWLVMPYELSGLDCGDIAQYKPWLLPAIAIADEQIANQPDGMPNGQPIGKPIGQPNGQPNGEPGDD